MGTNSRQVGAWSDALAAQIRAERAASGMTQAELIARAGMSRSTYLRIEAGTRVPDVTDLARIAFALGLPLSTLIRRAEDRLTAGTRKERLGPRPLG